MMFPKLRMTVADLDGALRMGRHAPPGISCFFLSVSLLRIAPFRYSSTKKTVCQHTKCT